METVSSPQVSIKVGVTFELPLFSPGSWLTLVQVPCLTLFSCCSSVLCGECELFALVFVVVFFRCVCETIDFPDFYLQVYYPEESLFVIALFMERKKIN